MKIRVAFLLLCSLLYICNSYSGETTEETVKKSGTVFVGMGFDVPPFSYHEKDQVVGFEIELAREVVKNMEKYLGRPLELKIVPVTDETRISWIQSGQINMSICHINNTRKRHAMIDFSVPYFWDGKGILYDQRKGTKDIKDFAGKTIGFKRSSSSEGEIQAYFAKMGWQKPILKQFDDHVAGIRALADGQIDGFTDDNSIIITVAMLGGYKVGAGEMLGVTATSYSAAYYGIGVQKNDSSWRDIINYSLHDFWLSGGYQKLYEKWFGPKSNTPIPLGNNHMEPFVGG